MVRVGGETSDDVGFCGVCIVSLKVVLNIFDHLGGGVECVLALSHSEVGMVTPSECCVSVCSKGGVSYVGIMPGVCCSCDMLMDVCCYTYLSWSCLRGRGFVCSCRCWCNVLCSSTDFFASFCNDYP